ncbi:MAG: GNAT family N-acetyltransferase [Acidobacteriota bacterium]|nr:GNAT family N-acetyltransferase [Acidobacteriota bacterium]
MRIVPYRAKHADAFASLNRNWLVAHDLWEESDAEDLNDPEGTILAEGGRLYVAEWRGTVAGTCAVIPRGEGVMEISRLAVHPEWQRLGIGRRMLARCVGYARRHGASRVMLLSSSRLTSALRLYRSFGFEQVPVPAGAKYKTADVSMELTFRPVTAPSTPEVRV